LLKPQEIVQSVGVSEEVLWKGSPSQVLNLGKYLLALLLAGVIFVVGLVTAQIYLWAALIIPVVWAIWICLQTRSIRTELTSERIRLEQGILNRKLDDVELYRVKDTSMERPFWYRLFGLSTLIIETSDLSQPRIEIKAVHDGDNLRESLRKQVELLRDKKRVREVDFDHMADGGGGDAGDHGVA
jgi:uncharacterized membrane protein YdbT with pleckstrin-like domain